MPSSFVRSFVVHVYANHFHGRHDDVAASTWPGLRRASDMNSNCGGLYAAAEGAQQGRRHRRPRRCPPPPPQQDMKG